MLIIEDSTETTPKKMESLFGTSSEEREYGGSREISICEICGHVMVGDCCWECDPPELADLFG